MDAHSRRTEAAGAKAGPHPDSGRRSTETARIVARPAEVVSLAGRRSNLAGPPRRSNRSWVYPP